jgi:hypothetical protein
MQIKNGKMNGTSDSVVATPSLHDIDVKIADARRARSEAIKRMVVGSVSAIDRRFLHRTTAFD